MHPADAQHDRDETDDRGEARQPDAEGTGGCSQEEQDREERQRRDPSGVRARPAPGHPSADEDGQGRSDRGSEDGGRDQEEKRRRRSPDRRPWGEISGQGADRRRGAAPGPVNDEQHRDAEERGGCRDRAQDHHELTRPHTRPPADRGQGRGRPAAEPGKPRHTRAGDRAAQRAPRVLSRKGSERLQSLIRDRARPSPQSHEQARDSEESREERKQDRIRIDEGWPSKDREAETGGDRLDPKRATEPTEAAPAAPFRGADRPKDANEERGRPRAKAVRQTDRIGQEEAGRNQCEDRGHAASKRTSGPGGPSLFDLAERAEAV